MGCTRGPGPLGAVVLQQGEQAAGHKGRSSGVTGDGAGWAGAALPQQQLLSHPALLRVLQKLRIPSSLLEPASEMDKRVSDNLTAGVRRGSIWVIYL